MGYEQGCARWAMVGWPMVAGEPVIVCPFKCNSWRCERCAPNKARRWFNIALSGARVPGRIRFITITTDTSKEGGQYEAWIGQGTRWNRLRSSLKSAGYTGEYLRVLEATKAGWPHIHLLWRGAAYIPQRRLSELADKAGFGRICHIKRADGAEGYARYVCKYLFKAADSTPVPFGYRRACKSANWPGPEWRDDATAPDPYYRWDIMRWHADTVAAGIAADGYTVTTPRQQRRDMERGARDAG